MGTIEFEVGVIQGKLIYDGKVSLPVDYDGYIRTIIVPGLADGHAHPQVIDVGQRSLYKDSYDWIKRRRLKVDERGIREDLEVSSKLAQATLLLSLFDGVTLIALTGSAQGNVIAIKHLSARPRVIIQPTLMDKKGWATPQEYLFMIESFLRGDQGTYVGMFLHSLGLLNVSSINMALEIAKERGLILAIHISEGVFESQAMYEISRAVDFDSKNQLVAVHCFTEPMRCKRLFRGVVSCPSSNLYLYGRTIKSPYGYDSLGSDWPLITGTLKAALAKAYEISGKKFTEVLRRATVGGYSIYNVDWDGDAALFDSGLSKVLTDINVKPKYVFVRGLKAIEEGTLNGSFDYAYAEKLKEEAVQLAFDRFKVGDAP